jgi:Spy/CpxP family protein refolding chaperone
MRNKTLILVLIFSVAVNVAVLAGFGFQYFRTRRPVSSAACPFTPQEHHFYQQLDLLEPQLQQIDPLAHKFHSRLAKLHAAMEAKKNRLVKLLSEDPLDTDRTEQTRREMAGIQQEIQKDVIEHILNIRNILNSEQQQRFFALLHKSLQQEHNWFARTGESP